MHQVKFIIGAGMLACVFAAPASANVLSGSTIIGVFEQPTKVGNVLNSPALGNLTFYNNNATAISSISNNTSATTTGNPPVQSTPSVLSWGDTNSGNGQVSTLGFVGATTPANVTNEFLIGRMTYVNGTSSLPSIIFGAKISFYVNSVSTANFLGSDDITINTTGNLGNNVGQDTDYLNFCGLTSQDLCQNRSVNAVEVSQGGKGVTFDLLGTIVGDPQLFIDSIQLAPGQSPTTNGFLSNDPPAALLPEPGTVALMGAGVVSLAFSRRKPS